MPTSKRSRTRLDGHGRNLVAPTIKRDIRSNFARMCHLALIVQYGIAVQ